MSTSVRSQRTKSNPDAADLKRAAKPSTSSGADGPSGDVSDPVTVDAESATEAATKSKTKTTSGSSKTGSAKTGSSTSGSSKGSARTKAKTKAKIQRSKVDKKSGTSKTSSSKSSSTSGSSKSESGAKNRKRMSAASMASGSLALPIKNEKADTSTSEGGLRAMLPFGRRVGGPAPFVPPKSRLSRGMRMREWSRRGFVQLSPGKQKLRHRILPRTVIGIAAMLMAVGVGAAFSGAAFYAYYDNRLAENERTVARFVEGFDQQFTDAAGALDDVRTESVGTIRAELGPLTDFTTDARGVVNLPATVGESVWLVETKDENGQVSHGSAFAIVGHEGGTALITSFEVVRSSSANPGPVIELVKGSTRIPASLWSWDVERDVAMLVVDRRIPILSMAGNNAQLEAIGSRVFAMSGFGGQGATASPGVLLDHSPFGLQHTASLGSFYHGGPLVDGDGKVLGVATAAYNPFDLEPGQVHMAPDIRAICVEILQCSEVEEVLSQQEAAEEATVEGQVDGADDGDSDGADEGTDSAADTGAVEDGDAAEIEAEAGDGAEADPAEVDGE